MKVRNGFVSNSSSSSFMILKNNLTKEQIEKIKNHIAVVNENKEEFNDVSFYTEPNDAWQITENALSIMGKTWMGQIPMAKAMGLSCKGQGKLAD